MGPDRDAQNAATSASTIVLMWLELLEGDPIDDLERRLQAALPGQGVSPTAAADEG